MTVAPKHGRPNPGKTWWSLPPVGARPAWRALEAHHRRIRDIHLRRLFADDPTRGERLTVEAADVFLDYSKNRVTDETLELLLQLAKESGLRERIDAMFRREKINGSEQRAVLHIALRSPRDATILVDGENVVPRVHEVLDRMSEFTDRVRSGRWTGHTGKRIRAMPSRRSGTTRPRTDSSGGTGASERWCYDDWLVGRVGADDD